MAPTVTSARISLGDLTPNNIGQLRVLNKVLFPVSYSDKFYKEVLEVEEFAKLGNLVACGNGLGQDLASMSLTTVRFAAYFNDVCVGAVCCREEPIDTNDKAAKLYIMTLGVLKPYRGQGVGKTKHKPIRHLSLWHIVDLITVAGKQLLDHILEHAAKDKDSNITEVYLHVQTTNQEALSFYKNHGFEITGTTNNYYKNIDDKDAHVLSKSINQ
jgi:ribosomal protein S18 acetylase RimI-like enzyme